MWTTKTFLTKTKRGNVLKIVREHYLRDDLLCGSAACNVCPQKDDDFVLEAKPESICALFDYNHYLVLDTNVVLHQIDVLEEEALKNVIILQTVLEEVKHQNTAIFQRLLEIIGNKKRKFYSFVNEHHKDTYVERNPGEKQNDRNDRAIRKAAAWYSSHLSINNVAGQFPQIVLLTDDENNRKIAQEKGIMCCSVKDYIENVNGFVGLVDKLSKNVMPESCAKDALYPAHMTPSQIHAGIRNGKLHQGTFHASRDNFLEGTASVSGHEKTVLLQGHIGINRAIDGDMVAIEILPKEEWSKPSDIVLEDKADDPGDFLEDPTLIKPKVDTADDDIAPTGKVVGIIKRKWRQYCGILLPSKFPGATRHLFTPAEKRIPRVRIETRQSDILVSQRILVALDSWPRNSRYPLGHFVRSLGPIGDKNAENEVILLEHDVPHARFSEAVLACLPPNDWTIPDEEIKKRVDLRSICVCSVDPPGCTDIDDALHARPLPAPTKDGLQKYDVGVHIADVTYFVRPNTALDKEAASRSTTVYLVDKRIDMVPDLLSSNLCSLRGGEERLAFSCVWEIDENANVLSTKFHKSVIKSRAAMTYEEAQLAIDEESRNDEVAASLRILNMLAKKMKQKRLDNGALLLASPEIRFQVDSETHDPIEVQAKKIVDTNSMVEEFMLLANVSVAEHLAAEFPQCALLRRHPAPPPANFNTFLKAARQQGFELDVSTNKAFSKSLDEAVIPGRPFFNTLLRIMATRCMQQAVYFSSGTKTQDEFYHYGLACPIYTHFTSPIRRYADVIVHRLLAASIGADVTHATLLDTKHADALCDNLNYRHRQAQYAGRASVALNTHILFKNREDIEAAVVLAVKRNALQVLIPKYGLEGPLYLPSDKFVYNEEENVQICGGTVLKTFDELTVRLTLDSSNLQHRKLVFQLVTPYIPGVSYVKEDSEGKQEVMDVENVNITDSVKLEKKRKDTVNYTKSKKKKSKNKDDPEGTQEAMDDDIVNLTESETEKNRKDPIDTKSKKKKSKNKNDPEGTQEAMDDDIVNLTESETEKNRKDPIDTKSKKKKSKNKDDPEGTQEAMDDDIVNLTESETEKNRKDTIDTKTKKKKSKNKDDPECTQEAMDDDIVNLTESETEKNRKDPIDTKTKKKKSKNKDDPECTQEAMDDDIVNLTESETEKNRKDTIDTKTKKKKSKNKDDPECTQEAMDDDIVNLTESETEKNRKDSIDTKTKKKKSKNKDDPECTQEAMDDDIVNLIESETEKKRKDSVDTKSKKKKCKK